ncbi:MAG: sugar transferase [Mangrovibacterium sp.]
MNKKVQVAKYLTSDLLTATASWGIFYIYRKVFIEPQTFGTAVPLDFTPRFYLGLVFVPLFWLLLYYLTGYYNQVFRKSRLLELGQTLGTTLAGVTILFFALLLDDYIETYQHYYRLFFTLFGLHFSLTYSFRLILTSNVIHQIHTRKLGFNTIFIGGNTKAVEMYRELNEQMLPEGFRFVGFLRVGDEESQPLAAFLPELGTWQDFPTVADQYKLEEVIVTIDSTQHELLSQLLITLQQRTVNIWGIPDLYDLLSAYEKTNTIYGKPLFKISNAVMPVWQANLKRLIDVIFSIVALMIFSPVIFAISILIKTGSPGPVFYAQTRIGRHGKPFTIYKFRTMFRDAEKNGPALATINDLRVTPIGRFLRRTHLDEIPQFFNVIIGEMSLVGPRPERQYYLDQLVARAPHFSLLHQIRPGITSWGQIKYGYASTIDEMLERLPYDLIYLKNISLYLDFKIMIYSILEIFHQKGK